MSAGLKAIRCSALMRSGHGPVMDSKTRGKRPLQGTEVNVVALVVVHAGLGKHRSTHPGLPQGGQLLEMITSLDLPREGEGGLGQEVLAGAHHNLETVVDALLGVLGLLLRGDGTRRSER